VIPLVCYTAALPLFIYAVLLMLGAIERTDSTVAVLYLAEVAAIAVSVRGLARRYRPNRRP
jgi:hypothetical protein